jgi:hypothetical protein
MIGKRFQLFEKTEVRIELSFGDEVVDLPQAFEVSGQESRAEVAPVGGIVEFDSENRSDIVPAGGLVEGD